MKKLLLFSVLSVYHIFGSMSQADFTTKTAQDFNLPRIIGILQELAGRFQASQSKDLSALVENSFNHLPFELLGFSDDEINQLLAQKLPAKARDTITVNALKALDTLRTFRFYLLNSRQIAPVLGTGFAQILTTQNLTPQGAQALGSALSYAKSNEIKLQDFGNKVVALIDAVGKYIKENIGSAQQIKALSDDQLLQKLQQILKLQQPFIQQILAQFKQFDMTKLKQIIGEFQKVDFSKINIAALQQQISALAPVATPTTTPTAPTTGKPAAAPTAGTKTH